MPLSGTGMLITLMDVDPEEEAEFNSWYDKEHLAERVSIEGFTEARRYIAVNGSPKYLNLYTTLTFDVLNSSIYRKVLQNQTKRSLHQIAKFRNAGRAIGRVSASNGQGRGSALFFAAVRPAAGQAEELRRNIGKRLAALVQQDGVISTHLIESDPELSKPLTEAEPPPNAGDWYLLLDGTDSDVVQTLGQELVGDSGVISDGALISQGVYRLLWDLSKGEL